MTVFYVDQDTGSDRDSGKTEGLAFRTLTKALQSVRPGDAVDVDEGTYSAQVLKTDRITVNFADGAVVDANGAQHAFLVFADKVTINGGGFTGGKAGIAANGADFLSLVGVEAYGNRGNGISLIGLDGAVVRGSYVHDNIGGRNDHSSGLSIYHLTENPNVTSAYGVRVIDCRFEDNGTLAPTDGNNLMVDKLRGSTPTPYDRPILIAESSFTGAGGSGAYVYQSDNVTFRGNYFAGNSTDPQKKMSTNIAFNDSHGDRVFGNEFHSAEGEFDFHSAGRGYNTATFGDNDWTSRAQMIAPWSGAQHDHPVAAMTAAYAADPHEILPDLHPEAIHWDAL